MEKEERKAFFLEKEDELLRCGASFSEWCTMISKSVYDAFVNGADLATIITAVACIETYLKVESVQGKTKKLTQLINEAEFLSPDEKEQLHLLRRYRNSWVHADRLDDSVLFANEERYSNEILQMSLLSVEMMLTVLFAQPYI